MKELKRARVRNGTDLVQVDVAGEWLGKGDFIRIIRTCELSAGRQYTAINSASVIKKYQNFYYDNENRASAEQRADKYFEEVKEQEGW
ncbi:hypothetical protein GL267_007280 [Acidithiobacillus ferrianus]|uniref:Uncharacterized protein n=2 Tax=Acidithiobacillus ferrianus TaxID=2678518 RepID=A0A845U9F7_9PROT|nr:hypothetical protein [Acidithiobacillus ferrianus]NDU42075.1 hypothetical protein [Acidithiobacillus ferrianus]